MKFFNTHVYDLAETIVASGYPMLSNYDEKAVLSDVQAVSHDLEFPERKFLDNKHIMRAIKLANARIGSGHSSFLKGILVSADVQMSLKVMKEFQRYVFTQIVSSTSTMHRITKFKLENYCDQYTDPRIMEILNELINRYNENPTSENFQRVVSNVPTGFELVFRFTTNYMSLKNMYHQRKDHKLSEWREEFTSWVKTLPLSRELIIGSSENK